MHACGRVRTFQLFKHVPCTWHSRVTLVLVCLSVSYEAHERSTYRPERLPHSIFPIYRYIRMDESSVIQSITSRQKDLRSIRDDDDKESIYTHIYYYTYRSM